MDFAQLLKGTLSADQNTRVQATQLLERAASENLPAYLLALTQILANESGSGGIVHEESVRVSAGLAAKNCLVARDAFRRQQLIETFQNIDAALKNQIKLLSLKALGSNETRAASTAAQLVAALAYVELPLNSWPDLLKSLHRNIVESDPTQGAGLRRASLEALGYICEETQTSVLEAASGEILAALVHGLGARESSPPVRQAAAQALLNSLDFLASRLKQSEEERNFVLRAIFEAVASFHTGVGSGTSDSMLPVALGGLECLVGVAEVLYDYLKPYMHQGLGELTVNAMSSSEPAIALQGIEFWSTVCDVELDILQQLDDIALADSEGTTAHSPTLHQFAQFSAATVVPILLTRMAAQGHEDDDEEAADEWTPAMAAATCLSLYANAVRSDLLALPTLIKFIEENLSSTDWHFREASVMAFGSILEGPSETVLEPLAMSTFPALFRLFTDPSISVRDTNMWALGRVCELHPSFIPLEHAEQLAASFANGLTQPPRVAASGAWALRHLMHRIVLAAESTGHLSSGPTDAALAQQLCSRILPQLTKMLLDAAQRPDADDSSLRSAAFEVLTAVLGEVPDPLDPTFLNNLIAFVLGILEGSVRMTVEALGVDDQVRASDIQSSCVGLIAVACKRAGAANVPSPTWQRIGGAFLAVSQAGAAGKTAITSLEDLFLALGSLLTDIQEAELKDLAVGFAAPFLPYVLGALARPDEAQLCRVVIGFVSDAARACKASAPIKANLDGLVSALQRILHSPTCQRELKPLAITAIGDLAAAVGGRVWAASPHFGTTFNILSLAAGIDILDEEDLDEVDFVCDLRLALVECMTWIIQGAKEEDDNSHNNMGNAPQTSSSNIPEVVAALESPIKTFILPFLFNRLAPWCLQELGAGSSVQTSFLDEVIRATSGLIGDLASLYPASSETRLQLSKKLAPDFLRIYSDKITESTAATQRWALGILAATR